MVSEVMAVYFLLPLYITSWTTLNLPYQSLQVLREVEQRCLSSFIHPKFWLDICYGNVCLFGPKEAAYL